jgi:hypothetical protein
MAGKARRIARGFQSREDPQRDEREVERLSRKRARTSRCGDASRSALVRGAHHRKSLELRSGSNPPQPELARSFSFGTGS